MKEVGLSITEIADELRADLEIFAQLGRRTVEQAWKVGDHLVRAKLIVKHGEWVSWLFVQGIGRDMALRFLKLRNGHQITELRVFDSVNEALKALPPSRQDNNNGKAALTGADKRLVERDKDKERIRELEQEKQVLTNDLDLASRQVEAVFDDDRPQLAAGVAQIANIQAELTSCISEREKQLIVIKDLKREVSYWKNMASRLGGSGRLTSTVGPH